MVVKGFPGFYLAEGGIVIVIHSRKVSPHLNRERMLIAHKTFYMQFFREGSPDLRVMILHALHPIDNECPVDHFCIRINMVLESRGVPGIESINVIVKYFFFHAYLLQARRFGERYMARAMREPSAMASTIK